MKKGQLLSLDFLFAIALIFLAIGIAVKFGETFVFEWQEQQQQIELEQYGQTAALLLLANPELTCEMKDQYETSLEVHINNCIDAETRIPNQFTNSALGLPPEYKFSIFNQTDSYFIFQNSSFPNPEYNTKNIFTTRLWTVVWQGNIPKAQIYRCLQLKQGETEACSLKEKTIILTVWKQ